MPRYSFTLRQGIGFPAGLDGSQLRTTGNDPAIRADNVAAAPISSTAFFAAAPLTYTDIDLNWSVETSIAWQEIWIVASTTGHPVTVLDGRVVTVVTSGDPFYNVIDSGLTPGTWYYYTLFVKINDGVNTYYQAIKQADALLPTEYKNTERLFRRIPEYYRITDLDLGQPLRRFVDLVGYEMDYTQTLMDTVRDIRKLQTIPVPALAAVANMLGVGPEANGISESRLRYLVQNIMHLRLRKGTLGGVASYIAALTGYQAKVTQVNATRIDVSIYAQRVNLVKNPKFNTMVNWSQVGFGSTTASGNVATHTSGPGLDTLTSNTFPVLAGREYAAGLQVNRLDAGNTISMAIRWNGTTVVPLVSKQTLQNGTLVQRLTTDPIIAPVGATTGELQILSTTTGTVGSTNQFTQAICEPGPVGEYFDGDTRIGGYLPGAAGQFDFRWEGTIDSSFSYYNLDFGRNKAVITNAFPYILPVGTTVGGSVGYTITSYNFFPQ